ncbi:hypothetical protein CC79DRAFT_1309691 [Sarocladium strictum]
MSVPWTRLIRFVATDGRILRGEPILPFPEFDVGNFEPGTQLQAKVLVGEDIYDTTGATRLSDEVATVKKLLGPLGQDDVPILRCVGLNYAKHIREAGRKPPPYPFIFLKARQTIADHDADVIIPKIAQDMQPDYEGELCFVMGKDAKDVKPEDAFQYIAAFTAGNDVSTRRLQRDPEFAGVVPQWGFSKGFDTFAPLGPVLVRTDVLGDPKKARLSTKIDGELRQDELVDDLLFDCAYLVSYLSSGTTLEKGSVIMTGTPGGVGAGMKPPQWLKHGTVMEVHVGGIGTLRNRVVFES